MLCGRYGYGHTVKVAIAFDHRGVHLRDAVLEALSGHSVVDLGTDTDAERIDYPDKALELGMAIRRSEIDRLLAKDMAKHKDQIIALSAFPQPSPNASRAWSSAREAVASATFSPRRRTSANVSSSKRTASA